MTEIDHVERDVDPAMGVLLAIAVGGASGAVVASLVWGVILCV